MVVLVTYTILKDPAQEAGFSALAGALFILPYFLFSAISGQLADARDKAKLIRTPTIALAKAAPAPIPMENYIHVPVNVVISIGFFPYWLCTEPILPFLLMLILISERINYQVLSHRCETQ